MTSLFLAAAAMALAAGNQPAQSAWTYRARMAIEATATRTNPASPLAGPGTASWQSGLLFVATADGSWEPATRVRFAGGAVVTADQDGDVKARAREGYLRLSAAPWLDVEAGKRLVRWGVGYGYAPTGILDPPKDSSDPTDRLGRNEGTVLARGDVFRGPASITIVAAAPRQLDGSGAARLAGARLRTVVGNGFEVAVVGGASSGTRPGYGANVTHVIGQRLEWHGEVLLHGAPRSPSRAASSAIGMQYTFPAGVNVVVEYHRNAGEHTVRNSVFTRFAPSASERAIVPELIAIASVDDGGVTIVPSVTWTPKASVQVYVRATGLAGPARSRARLAPWSAAVTFGAAARF